MNVNSVKKLIKTGYTYAAYHRGAKRGEPQSFVRTDKRVVSYGGVRRVRNVYKHPVTGEEYIFSDGYFIRVEQ